MTPEEKQVKNDIEQNGETLDNFCEILIKDAPEYLKAVQEIQSRKGYDEGFYHLVTSIIFIKYSIRDIFMLYKIFYASTNVEERNLLARTMATHVAGFIKDFDNIQGKTMNQLILHVKNAELESLLSSLRTIFKTIKKKHGEMRTIRNAVSAHKDRDIIKQLEIIENINFDEWLPIIAQIQLFTLSIVLFEQALIKTRIERATTKKESYP